MIRVHTRTIDLIRTYTSLVMLLLVVTSIYSCRRRPARASDAAAVAALGTCYMLLVDRS